MFQKIRLFFKLARESNYGIMASAMAFNTTLSLIPLLAIAIATFKTMGGFEKIQATWMPILFKYLAVGTSPEFLDRINYLSNKASSKVLTSAGFVLFFFTSARLIIHMDQAIQRIWGLKELKKVGKRFIYYVFFLFVVPLGFAFLFGSVGFFNLVNMKKLHMETYLFSFLFLMVFFLNQLVPPTKVLLRYSFFSAVFVTISLFLMHKIFFFISKNVLIYSKIYGSFASIPIFLLWVQWCWQIFFFGVLLCSLLNKKYFDKKSDVVIHQVNLI